MQKSPDAFRTISEVALDLDVPQHVLRFWESKFNQIRPLKRGGGRRYYRPEDIDLLRGVRTLLYNDGYTIKGVQKVFREQGARFIMETGRGKLDGSFAEAARGAVERINPNLDLDDDTPLSSKGRTRLKAVLRDLLDLKEELDEAQWDGYSDDS